MPPGLRALLEGLVDYAGLFPPATLDLDPAIQNHARYRSGPEAWMLGRFIVPAHRLGEMAPHADRFTGSPLRLSVLGLAPEADGADAWLDAAVRTVGTARDTTAAHPALVGDRFEIRVPTPLACDPDRLGDALSELDEAFQADAADPPRAALEVTLDALDAVGAAASAIADANGRASRPAFALKFRCGGVTPDLVPEIGALSTAIEVAHEAGVPFKATAGLHHPLPNHDAAVGTRIFGFLGVFGGGILARVHGLSTDDIAEILDDERAASWSFDDGLRWRSLSASAGQVAEAREAFALSFGSCSFDEPRDDLR
ncbi:MAG: hypothetical protein AAGJ11_11330, partial [Bacteroidota bacterium]